MGVDIREVLEIFGEDNTQPAVKSALGGQKKLKKGSDTMSKGMAQNATQVQTALLKIGAVAFTAKKAFDFAKEAAGFAQSMASFTLQVEEFGLNATQTFENLRRASGNLVDDASLAQAANTAISLGIEVDNLGNFLEIARAKGREMGLTTEEAFEKLVIALGRGSALRLDDLGIIVKQGEANKAFADSIGRVVKGLSGQERQQAFINAAVKAGAKALDRQNLSTLTMAENMQAFEVTLKNVRTELGFLAIRIGTGLIGVLQGAQAAVLGFTGVMLGIPLAAASITDALGITENAAQGWENQMLASFDAANEAAKKSEANINIAFASTQELIEAQTKLQRGAGAGPKAEKEKAGISKEAEADAKKVKDILEELRLKDIQASLNADQKKLANLDNFHAVSLQKLMDAKATEEEISQATVFNEQARLNLLAEMRDKTRQEEIAFAIQQHEFVKELRETGRQEEIEFERARLEFIAEMDKIETEQRVSALQDRFSLMANLANTFLQISKGQSRTAFEAFKIFATGEAVVNTYRAAAAALANPPGPPWSFGTMALALAQGFLQVQRIQSMQFGGGGTRSTSVPRQGAARPAPGAAGTGQTPTEFRLKVIVDAPPTDSIVDRISTQLLDDIGDGRINLSEAA